MIWQGHSAIRVPLGWVIQVQGAPGRACPCPLPHSQHLSPLLLGMLDSNLALQKGAGAGWSGQPRQGQRWEQPNTPGVASVPGDMAWLEAERHGWHYPVHTDSQRMKLCRAVHTQVFAMIPSFLCSLWEHLAIYSTIFLDCELDLSSL